MARASTKLIASLHKAAAQLKEGQTYQWGHMGSCNCGNLAQVITKKSKAEIHSRALLSRSGDWREQLYDYCPASNLPMDELIDAMLETGLTRTDLHHLERLSDPEILKSLPTEALPLVFNHKEHVIIYLHAWASLLEIQLQETEFAKLLKDSINKPSRQATEEKFLV